MTSATTTRVIGPDAECLRHAALDSPIGTLTVIASPLGIRAILWADEDAPGDITNGDGHEVLMAAVDQLREYFAGDRTVFDLPLDLIGTDFQVEAWRALAEVPFGTTVTYGEQARRLGRPTAFRAVGAANGRNPVPIVLPCHRIVGSDGSLTGFGGGLDTKRWLLDHEQHDRLF